MSILNKLLSAFVFSQWLRLCFQTHGWPGLVKCALGLLPFMFFIWYGEYTATEIVGIKKRGRAFRQGSGAGILISLIGWIVLLAVPFAIVFKTINP